MRPGSSFEPFRRSWPPRRAPPRSSGPSPWQRASMRSVDRCMERCTCSTPIAWRRWSRLRCSRCRSWRASRRGGPGSSWAMGRCVTPMTSPAGSVGLQYRSRACPRGPRSSSPSWNGRARAASSKVRPPRSPCTDVLRKRRPDGRRATAARCPIRPAPPAAVDDVGAIARAVFSDPWSGNDFRECVNSGVPFLVAEQRGVVAGYVVAHYAADEGEILNLGVAAAHRRQGIGRALVERVLQALAQRGVGTVYLEVRASNAAARQLYQALGFGEVARRARYFRAALQDARLFPGDIAPAGGAVGGAKKLRKQS